MTYALAVSETPPSAHVTRQWIDAEYPNLCQSVTVSRGTIPPIVYLKATRELTPEERVAIVSLIDDKSATYEPPTIFTGL